MKECAAGVAVKGCSVIAHAVVDEEGGAVFEAKPEVTGLAVRSGQSILRSV